MSNNFINNFLIVLGKNKKANPRKNKIGIAIIKIIGEKMRSGIKTDHQLNTGLLLMQPCGPKILLPKVNNN